MGLFTLLLSLNRLARRLLTISIFVFAVNCKRHFYFCMIYLRITWKEKKNRGNIREFKPDVYGRQQTVNIYYLWFSILFMLSLNKSYKNRKVSLTIHCKYKYFESIVQRAEDRRQKFYFCRLPFAVCRKRQT